MIPIGEQGILKVLLLGVVIGGDGQCYGRFKTQAKVDWVIAKERRLGSAMVYGCVLATILHICLYNLLGLWMQ